MRYFGLDLSMSATGFCCLDERGTLLRTIKTTPAKCPDLLDRIEAIWVEIWKGIGSADNCLVALEDIFVPVHSPGGRHYGLGATMNLIALGTLVRYHLRQEKVDFIAIPPTSLKKFVTGKGNSPKDQLSKEIFKKYGVDAGDNNQADACGLAHFAEGLELYRNGKKEELLKPQIEAIEKLF